MPMRHSPRAVVLAIACFFASDAAAESPSFDCATNFAPDEVTICKNNTLAALDRQMAVLYSSLWRSFNADQQTKLRNEQRSWLRQRASCQTKSACITAAYQARISQLKILSGSTSPPASSSPAPGSPAPSNAQANCSGRTGDAWTRCVWDVASWECRAEETAAALKSCYLQVFSRIEAQDKRTLRYVKPLVCNVNQDKQLAGTVKWCDDSQGGKGAGEEECYRVNVSTIKVCLYESGGS